MNTITLKKRESRVNFELIEKHEFKDFMKAVDCYNEIFDKYCFDKEHEEITKGGNVRCYNRHTHLMIEFIED